jgi:hypothetical protein
LLVRRTTVTDTDTMTRPNPKEVRPGLTDKAEVSHIVRDEDWAKGYIWGQEIEALCGIRWIPSRDPEKYPVCQPCQKIYEEGMES